MNSASLFFVLLFLFFVSVQSKTLSYTYTPKGDEVYVVSFKYPLYVPGNVTVQVQASYDIELCFQEFASVQGSLRDCNEGGYLFFSPNGTKTASPSSPSSPDFDSGLRFRDFDDPNKLSFFTTYASEKNTTTYTASLDSLKGGSVYYLSVRYNYSFDNTTTNTWSVYISFSDPCPSGVGLPNGMCQPYTNTTWGSSAPVVTILPTVPLYFQLPTGLFVNSIKVQATINTGATTEAAAASVKLYLRRGGAPTTSFNDAVSTTSGNVATVSYDQPLLGSWFLLISSNLPLTFQLNTTQSVCPKDMYGSNCSISLSNITDMTDNYNLTTMTGTGDYQYFKLRSSTLIFGAATQKLDVIGPALTASYLNLPSNESKILTSSGDEVNFLWTEAEYLPDGLVNITWFVSVWFNDGEDYVVWANVNCANLCQGDDYQTANATATGNGRCDAQSGTCYCDDDYDDLTCTKKGLAVVWIVLIVIAAVIILAVAIGVPVACYLRNKRRARYERV